MKKESRRERDILGALEVPNSAYWGINTQRAIQNFQISGRKFPESFIMALAKVKKACLKANFELGRKTKRRMKRFLQPPMKS